MKTKPSFFNHTRVRQAARLWVAALPLALAACGAAEPTQTNTRVGGTSGSVGSLPTASCVPMTQQIPFTASNAYVASRKIYAGTIPSTGSVGTVMVGGAVGGGGTYQGVGLDNSVISMNLTPTSGQTTTGSAYTGYTDWLAYQSYATATGFLQIGTMLQQQAALLVQLGQIPITGLTSGAIGYTSTWTTPSATMPGQTVSINPSQLCVSNLAFTLNIHPYYNTLYIGDVYVYLNNTQHGFTIEF
jgi:hypothetical protein